MALLKTSKPDNYWHRQNGFSMVEIIVAVAIMAIIFSLGLVLSMDFYRTYAFNYEMDLIIGTLQKVRSQSMANVDQSSYGMSFNAIDHEYKLLKEGVVEQTFEANDAITVTWSDIVSFNQLEGKCVSPACSTGVITINLTGLGKTHDITINNEGRINY